MNKINAKTTFVNALKKPVSLKSIIDFLSKLFYKSLKKKKIYRITPKGVMKSVT